MTNIYISPASPEKLKDLSLLWLEFIQDEMGSDLNIIPCEENGRKWIEFVRTIMEKNSGAIKYAIVSGEIVGYVLYRWDENTLQTYKKRGTILDLYVKRTHRRMGIGAELLKEAIDDLKKHKVDFIQLNVLSSNQIAINLYKKFGFEEQVKIMRLKL